MYVMKNQETGDTMGPYATKRLALSFGPKGDQWKPVSIGKRSMEQALALGAAINSAKVAK